MLYVFVVWKRKELLEYSSTIEITNYLKKLVKCYKRDDIAAIKVQLWQIQQQKLTMAKHLLRRAITKTLVHYFNGETL